MCKLSVIAQAAEFREIRLKPGEKSLYRHINRDVGIKFPIKVDIALSAHKVSLLLQAELGALDFPISDQFAKHRGQFQQDKSAVLQHVNRLIRCVIDCQLGLGDSVSARNALELARSFAARVWDNSPLQLKQLDQIGNVAVRKFANANVNSIEALENTEAHRIETVIGRGPPFGMKLLSTVAKFPKLRVSVKSTGNQTTTQRCIEIKLKAEIGFLNERIPFYFHRKPIYICFLAETSNGQIIDFRRMAASKLQNGHSVFLTAELTKQSQYVTCYVMCDEIAGTCRFAEFKPDLPASLFSNLTEQIVSGGKMTDKANASEGGQSHGRRQKRKSSNEFDDSGLGDDDLLAAESAEIMEIDCFDDPMAPIKPREKREIPKKQRLYDRGGESVLLKNGNWACNHRCKDKAKCKHLCCREGLHNPPKQPKKPSGDKTEGNDRVRSLMNAVNDHSAESILPTPPKEDLMPEKIISGQRADQPQEAVSRTKSTNPNSEAHGTAASAEETGAQSSLVAKDRSTEAEPEGDGDFYIEDPFESEWVTISPEDIDDFPTHLVVRVQQVQRPRRRTMSAKMGLGTMLIGMISAVTIARNTPTQRESKPVQRTQY